MPQVYGSISLLMVEDTQASNVPFIVLACFTLLLSLFTANHALADNKPAQLSAENVLVLYKFNDDHSKQIADYYAQQRKVPKSQVVAVNIKGSPSSLSKKQFKGIYSQLKPKLTDNIKVILMTWHAPYRVECMSITSAFAFGFDKKYCSHKTNIERGCKATATSPYYNAESATLWQQNAPFKLSMMLSATSVDEAKKVIDNGIAADNSFPKAQAYLIRTNDSNRSSRWSIFERFAELWGDRKDINVNYIDAKFSATRSALKNKDDVMFYHTGMVSVPHISTNTYLPGAIAEHLTSTGGAGIGEHGQMKAFRWLEAGVTGSYGAVVEPCNYPAKFPNPQVLIPSYRDGKTLVEAYWKSVQQPGEGLFIGEPLARPWGKEH